MEFIVNTAQFEKMIDNRIIGIPDLINSKINFRGKNNILVFENDIKLENVVMDFNGDNSLIYVCSSLNDLFHLEVYNNSTVFIGKDISFGSSVNLRIFENQNVIIGDGCVIENNVMISTSDLNSIYDMSNKKRINFADSVFIGDHVWLGYNSFISKGVHIGSGSIIDNLSFVGAYGKVPSNVLLSGNPAKIIQKQVFFTKDFTGPFKKEDSLNSEYYKSDVFFYNFVDRETLNLNKINDILFGLSIEERLEFIQKLFVKNKRKNRFSR